MRGFRLSHSRDTANLVADDGSFRIDDDICQLTRLQTEPFISNRKSIRNHWKVPVSTTSMLLAREANHFGRGRFSLADRSHVLGRYLPMDSPSHTERMYSEAYTSQFSIDGSLFIVGLKGSLIKIYNVEKGWKVQKDINARSLRWTITDTALSPDQRQLVYSSLTPIVHLVNVWSATTDSQANITEIHEALDFSGGDGEIFNTYSIKFSTDGRELVAGSSTNSIYVYDLEANKLSWRLRAHSDDVNTVSFADRTGQILFSGSDDNLCKVWDRRCFAATEKPAGVLEGHLEGITFIDSRGDGHYLISNGKDQTTKLWDIRKMSSTTKLSTRKTGFDYRWMEYPEQDRKLKHPYDQSVATYRGHSVLGTLIRCYFSPAHSTGQRYIYTGSFDNHVYIYDVVNGQTVARLEWHSEIIRDCSWHPYFPMLMSSSLDCFIARWEFPGNSPSPQLAKKRHRRRHAA
ncbi:LEC14B homolog [Zingiber officinale]|uniref:LEC14B homolog n=1 Tax=Zingiber officinale TaxID=94328 RepID=UPI001C4C4AB3|nr:LEC14B homolog [Zingiber officinale]XP_042463962.1 LEC14B homolog [Zingiber officinale]